MIPLEYLAAWHSESASDNTVEQRETVYQSDSIDGASQSHNNQSQRRIFLSLVHITSSHNITKYLVKEVDKTTKS